MADIPKLLQDVVAAAQPAEVPATIDPNLVPPKPVVEQPQSISGVQYVPQLPPETVEAAKYFQAVPTSEGGIDVIPNMTAEEKRQKVINWITGDSKPRVTAADVQTLTTPQQQVQAALPSQEEVDVKLKETLQPIREARAQKFAMDKLGQLQADENKVLEQERADVQRQIQDLDSQVRTKSFTEIMQQGTFGQKLGASIALALGAVSQGLLNQKTNPVMDFMNSVAEAQAQKDKLTAEQKLALKKQLLDTARTSIDKMANASNNAYRRDSLMLEKQKLDQEAQNTLAELQAKFSTAQKLQGIYSGRPLTAEEMDALKPEQWKQAVNLPNGTTVLARTGNTDDFQKSQANTMDMLREVKILQDFAKTGYSRLSPQDRRVAQVTAQSLAGKLREPKLGPGTMTEQERQIVLDMIGNPTKLFALSGTESRLLNMLEDEAKTSLVNKARSIGITNNDIFPDTRYYRMQIPGTTEIKAVPEAQLIEIFKAKFPKADENTIRATIQRSYSPL